MTAFTPHPPYAGTTRPTLPAWAVLVRDRWTSVVDRADDGHPPVLTWGPLVLGAVLGLLLHTVLVSAGGSAALATAAALIVLVAATVAGWVPALRRVLRD